MHDHRAVMRVIGGIVLCILLAALDQTVVIPAVPAIAADLNGFGHLSWIVTAYLIVSTVTTPLYGKLSDHFGRRRLRCWRRSPCSCWPRWPAPWRSRWDS